MAKTIKFQHKRKNGQEVIIEGEIIPLEQKTKEVVFLIPNTGFQLRVMIVVQQILKAKTETDELGNPVFGYNLITSANTEPADE